MKVNKTSVIVLLALLLLAGYFFFKNSSTTIKKEQSDFAIEDTASVVRVELYKKGNAIIKLDRMPSGKWQLNESFAARPDAIQVLLETIKKVKVKAPVPKAAFENIVKDIAANGTKVSIFTDNGDEPSKVFYVGSSNQQHNGTYMLLEQSTVPFLMHIEGVNGYLNTRFFVNENEWRSTEVFHAAINEIQHLSVEDKRKPENSFEVEAINNTDFFNLNINGSAVAPEKVDTSALFQYLSYYSFINFEGFEETKTEQFIDSVKLSNPFKIISLTDKLGKTTVFKAFDKPMPPGSEDFEGNVLTVDMDRMYGYINDKEFVVAQYFVFDKLSQNPLSFIKR